MAAAQWVEAVGTSGALLLGAAAYSQSVRDRRRDQASKVSAWVETDRVMVKNTSAEPVYHVSVHLWDHYGGYNIDGYYDDIVVLPGHAELPVALPKEAQDYNDPALRDADDTSPLTLLQMLAIPEIRFTDRAGRYWERTTSGRLIFLGWYPATWLHRTLQKVYPRRRGRYAPW